VPLLAPPSPIVPTGETGVEPIHDTFFAGIDERPGDDHHHSIFKLAAWCDAKGEIANLPLHNLLPMRSVTLHPRCTPESSGVHAGVALPCVTS
jgi:hypothetical protein